MANWCGVCRSNCFKVKDIDAFEKDFRSLGVVRNDDGSIFIYDEEGSWPTYYPRDEGANSDEESEIDFAAELAGHLQEGEVAVLQTVGKEKLRYPTGFALAVHSSGKVLSVDIDDIYSMVNKEFGLNPRGDEV